MKKILINTLILQLLVQTTWVHAQDPMVEPDQNDAIDLALAEAGDLAAVNEEEQKILDNARNFRFINGELYQLESEEYCDEQSDSTKYSKEETETGKPQTITQTTVFNFERGDVCVRQKLRNSCEGSAFNIHEAHYLITSQISKELSVKMIPGYDTWRDNDEDRAALDDTLNNVMGNLHGYLSCAKGPMMDNNGAYEKHLELIKILRKLSNFKNLKDEIYGANKCNSRYHDNDMILNPVINACYLNENDPADMLEISEISQLVNATNNIEEFLQAEKYRTPDNRPNTGLSYVDINGKRVLNPYSTNNNPNAAIVDESDYGERIYYFGIDVNGDGKRDKIVTQDEYYKVGKEKGWKALKEYSDMKYHSDLIDPFTGVRVRDKYEKDQLRKKVEGYNKIHPDRKLKIEVVSESKNKYTHERLMGAIEKRKNTESEIQRMNHSSPLKKEQYATAFSDLGSLGRAHQDMYFTASKGLAGKMLENKLLINHTEMGTDSGKWSPRHSKYIPSPKDYIKIKNQILNKMCPIPNHKEILGTTDHQKIKNIAEHKCREQNGQYIDEHYDEIRRRMELPEEEGGWRNLHSVKIRDNINKSIKNNINVAIKALNKTKVNRYSKELREQFGPDWKSLLQEKDEEKRKLLAEKLFEEANPDKSKRRIRKAVKKGLSKLVKGEKKKRFDMEDPETQKAYQNYVNSFKIAAAENPQNNLMFMESDKTAFNLITTNKCPDIVPVELKDLDGDKGDIKPFPRVTDREMKCAIQKSNEVLGDGALTLASDYYKTMKDVYDYDQLIINGLPDSTMGIVARQSFIKERMANLGRYVPELLGKAMVDNPSLSRHYCSMIEAYEFEKNLEKGMHYTALAAAMLTGIPAGVGGLLAGGVIRTGTGMIGRRLLGAGIARTLGKGGELVIRNLATFNALAMSGAAFNTLEVVANYHVNVKPAEVDAMMMNALVYSGNSEDLEKMTQFNKTKNTEKWWNAAGIALAPLDLFAMNEFNQIARQLSKTPSRLSNAVETGSFMRRSLLLNKAQSASSDFANFLHAMDTMEDLSPLAKARLKNYLAALNDDSFAILQKISKDPKRFNKFLAKVKNAQCLGSSVTDECLKVVEDVLKYHNSAFYQAGKTDNFYRLSTEQLLELRQDIKQSDELHTLIYFEDATKTTKRSVADQRALIELYGELKGVHKFGNKVASSKAIDKLNDAVRMCGGN